MNKMILMGRLTADPEVRESKGKDPITISNFRLAVNRAYAREDDEVTADFFSCTAFGRTAEFVEKFLVQGIKVLVTGRMQNDNYTNRDGDKVYGMNLIVVSVEFAESKKASEGRSNREDEYSERGSSRNRRPIRSGDRTDEEENRRSSRRDSREDDSGRGRSHRDVDDDREISGGRSSRSARDRRERSEDEVRSSRSRTNGRSRDTDDDFMDMDDIDADLAFD